MRRIVLLVACLLAVTFSAAFVLGASVSVDVPKPGDVITGRDLGFRVERVGSDHVVGQFVIRVHGEWTEAEPPSRPLVIPAKP